MERSKSDSRFPVLQASRLKEMMDASKLSQKMDKAETERVRTSLVFDDINNLQYPISIDDIQY